MVHCLDPELSFLLIPGRKGEEADFAVITGVGGVSMASYDTAVSTLMCWKRPYL